MTDRHPITPRPAPDLGLDGDIPRFWLENDAFKTRYIDAMALTFPDGERYFIQCVRDWRDQVTDPKLAAEVKDFIYQEGQHGMVHTQYNERLKVQGMAVDRITAFIKKRLDQYRRTYGKEFNLGRTAGAEHLTAMMCHGFFGSDMLVKADPRIRAMYAWHSVEEIEHKAVAFDVFEKVAKGGYWTRIASFLHVSVLFPLHTLFIMRHMLKVDGQNTWKTWAKGLWWLYGPGGLWPGLMPHYFAYFKPGFHPWKHGDLKVYEVWSNAMRESGGDYIAAGQATIGAAA
ncbi:MAG TPA: metal-dependent hydrolase [Verrucomicrobiae bacterium]|nr:metal-dependent hydrolase [Verrucomicrobiae bacterium]